jgi:hypothetical protein
VGINPSRWLKPVAQVFSTNRGDPKII